MSCRDDAGAIFLVGFMPFVVTSFPWEKAQVTPIHAWNHLPDPEGNGRAPR